MSGGSNRTSLAPSPEDQDQDGNAGNPNPDSISTDQKCTASRVKTVIKNIFAQLFSHAGLFLLVIGYSLMGAVLFRSLEGKKEEETKFEVEALRNSTLDDLYSITGKINEFLQFGAKNAEDTKKYYWIVTSVASCDYFCKISVFENFFFNWNFSIENSFNFAQCLKITQKVSRFTTF